MAKHTCPNCAHTWTTGKAPTRALQATDPSPEAIAAMSDTELYAYRKRTAPVEDARFFLRTQGARLSVGHAFQLEELIRESPPRTVFLRHLALIQAAHWQTVPWGRFLHDVEREQEQAEREAARQAAAALPEQDDLPELPEEYECGTTGCHHLSPEDAWNCSTRRWAPGTGTYEDHYAPD